MHTGKSFTEGNPEPCVINHPIKNCPSDTPPCPRCKEANPANEYCRSCRLGLILQCVDIDKFYQRQYNKTDKKADNVVNAGSAEQQPQPVDLGVVVTEADVPALAPPVLGVTGEEIVPEAVVADVAASVAVPVVEGEEPVQAKASRKRK